MFVHFLTRTTTTSTNKTKPKQGLTDYPQIIKHPMDLGTIRTKLKNNNNNNNNNTYKTFYQVAEDVRLVWSNCMTYNADGSDFYKLAESLQKKWEEKYTKLLQECSPVSGSNAAAAATTATATATSSSSKTDKVPLTEKRNFAKTLYQISKEDLGRVLVELEQKCPAALVRSAKEESVEINVDNISSTVLQELQAFLQTANKKAKKSGGGSSSKKPKSTATAAAPASAASK